MNHLIGNLESVAPVIKSNSSESLCSMTTDGVPLTDRSSLLSMEESILKTPVKNETPNNNRKSPLCHLISSVRDSKLHLLWPKPQQLIQLGNDHLFLEKAIQVKVFPCSKLGNCSIQDVVQAWMLYEEFFQKLNYSLKVVPSSMNDDSEMKISCQINSALMRRSESYNLTVTSKEIRIVANGLPGLHHAVRTILQLLTLYNKDDGIPFLYIYDWPVIPHRALLLNFSLDASKTYSFETLKHLIDGYSRLKLNQLHLYVKFSARDGWQLPYSQIELLELVEYCKARVISIVPTLDVAVDTHFQDLAIMYPSIQQFLVSLDFYEFVHIGSNLGKLFTNSPNSVWQHLPLDQGQAVFLSWNDTIQHVPFNVIPVHCDPQGFDEGHLPIDEIKIGCCSATRVEAVTSCCITGYPKTTIGHIHRTIQKCANCRNLAVIIGDVKESTTPDCTSLAFVFPGLLAAVGLAWNIAIHEDYLEFQIAQLLNKHIILDSEEISGQIIIELGRAEVYVLRTWSDDSLPVHSVLWQFFVQPDEVNLENLTVDTFQKAMRHIKHCQQQLHRTKIGCFQSGELVAELQLAVDLLLLACRIGQSLVSLGLNPNASFGVSVINAGINNLPPTSRTDLANKLLGLTEQFRAIWLSRHLPSGLHAPLLLFTSLLQKLVPDETNDE